MEFKDYYKILGVEADADSKAIKTAYRKLARKYHPDVSKEGDAEARFKEVTEAYEVLGDAKKRAEYDELRQYGRGGQDFEPPPGWQPAGGFGAQADFEGDFSDFFDAIFGGARRQRSQHDFGAGFGASTRGRDVELDLPLFLEDTIKEASQPIAYNLPHYDASGRGIEDIKKTLNVKIPTGVADGERIRLKGQGAPGIGDGPPGDLYLRIRLVPHPLFDIEGHNLIITVPIFPWEAALGSKVTVPTLEGKIQMTIPPNSQSGQRLRVKGKGLPSKSHRGDLYAVLNVVMPEQDHSMAKALWEQLAAAYSEDPRAEWSKAK